MELTTIAPQSPSRDKRVEERHTPYGLLIASSILGLWAISLGSLLALDWTLLPVWLIPLAMLWQMFLYTGLFITAHDAMHGSVYSQNPQINHWIGALAVTAYGFFSYKELLKKHQLHHRFPASDRDPDFHDGMHQHPIRWYSHFMSRYWNWKQFAASTLLFYSLQFFFHVSSESMILFWIIPSILSSVQLFYFGTFLTHREPEGGYQHPHRTQTNSLPIFWSFITCYHFGYHEEHHDFPHVPWWKLPSVYKRRVSA